MTPHPLELIETQDLVAELTRRMDTCLILGITLNNDRSLTYHRRAVGDKHWALLTPLLVEIDIIKYSYSQCPEEEDPVSDF